MSETDAGVNSSGQDHASSAWIMPALILIGVLATATAAMRFLPGLKDHLQNSTIKSKSLNLINKTEETKTLSLPPMAWVWSEYRGVAQESHASLTSQPSRSSPVLSAVREVVDTGPGQIAGRSPTSIAWVWSEYRGGV